MNTMCKRCAVGKPRNELRVLALPCTCSLLDEPFAAGAGAGAGAGAAVAPPPNTR